MSRYIVPLFVLLLILPASPLVAASSQSVSRVAHMKQRVEIRRRARFARRFPSSPPSSFSSFASFSSSSSSSSPTIPTIPPPPILDPLQTTDIRADIPLLGTVTPIMGSVRIFPEQEPVEIRTILVDFVDAPSSLDSLLLYDGERRLLGRATLDASVAGGRRFTLRLLGNTFVIPKREERSVYVRALLKARDAGGTSGDIFQVKEIRVEGDGVWSNEPYGKTLTAIFPSFQTARARIASIANAEESTGALAAGQRQRIAAFRFVRERSDASAELRVTSLTFQVSAASDVTLTNAILRGRDAGDDHGCTVGSVTITCSAIPAAHGVIGDGGRVLELYADIALSGATTSPFLQITLNDPGTVESAGGISWTDGTTTFIWVQFEQPVARGIRLR